MDRHAMREVAERAIAAFNDPARREEYFTTLYDDDVVLHGYAPVPLEGRDAVRAFYQPILDAFPDCRVTIEQALAEGDRLALGYRFAGTHQADFQGVPATGRPFDIGGMTILRFGGRRCVERWAVADFLSLMIQIGAIPAPA